MNFSTESWCEQCRGRVVDPREVVGGESAEICPHTGWVLVDAGEDGLVVGVGDAVESAGSGDSAGISRERKEKPVLGKGGGVVAQSAVQFSHLREEAEKDDPGVHREKDAGMMGALIGVFLGLCAVVAFFMFFPHGEDAAIFGGSGKSAGSTGLAVLGQGESKQEVLKFIDEISRIEDPDQLLEVIRFPELLEPMVRARHEEFPTTLSVLKDLVESSYTELSVFGDRFGALSMRHVDGAGLAMVLVEIGDDGQMLLDWEVLVGAGERYWNEFEAKQPTVGVPLWVSMHRTSIIDVPLPDGEDPDEWMALKVMSPVAGLRGTVYLTLVKKGDAFGDYIKANIPWNTEAPNGRVMAVTARFIGGVSSMLVIDELRAPGAFRSPGDDAVFPLESWK